MTLKLWFETVPIQLYSRAYDRFFDPCSLTCWEAFLGIIIKDSQSVRCEAFRLILVQSMSRTEGRALALLLKTIHALINFQTLRDEYKRMLHDELGPQLKSLCLGCMNNPDAKAIYRVL